MNDECLPREHPRTTPVEKARRAIGSALIDLRSKHKLTATEYLGILAEEMQSTLRGCLRAERHPEDSSLPADVE